MQHCPLCAPSGPRRSRPSEGQCLIPTDRLCLEKIFVDRELDGPRPALRCTRAPRGWNESTENGAFCGRASSLVVWVDTYSRWSSLVRMNCRIESRSCCRICSNKASFQPRASSQPSPQGANNSTNRCSPSGAGIRHWHNLEEGIKLVPGPVVSQRLEELLSRQLRHVEVQAQRVIPCVSGHQPMARWQRVGAQELLDPGQGSITG